MKHINKNQSLERKNGSCCVVNSYEVNDPDVNFAISKISGRYPSSGRALNALCKELAYVHEGTGKIVVNDVVYHLNTGDLILIDAGEKFYWKGNMTLHICCNPAFSIEQHQLVD